MLDITILLIVQTLPILWIPLIFISIYYLLTFSILYRDDKEDKLVMETTMIMTMVISQAKVVSWKCSLLCWERNKMESMKSECVQGVS